MAPRVIVMPAGARPWDSPWPKPPLATARAPRTQQGNPALRGGLAPGAWDPDGPAPSPAPPMAIWSEQPPGACAAPGMVVPASLAWLPQPAAARGTATSKLKAEWFSSQPRHGITRGVVACRKVGQRQAHHLRQRLGSTMLGFEKYSPNREPNIAADLLVMLVIHLGQQQNQIRLHS